MDIIKNFGIDPWLLGAQIVNFLIILILLKKFAYKPILEMLEQRRKTIEEGQKNAQKADASLQKALEEEKRLLKNAQADINAKNAETKKQAEAMIAEAQEKAKAQSERIIKEAREQIERERKDMEKQLATKTAELALSILEQSLQGFFDEKQQKEVLEKARKALKK